MSLVLALVGIVYILVRMSYEKTMGDLYSKQHMAEYESAKRDYAEFTSKYTNANMSDSMDILKPEYKHYLDKAREIISLADDDIASVAIDIEIANLLAGNVTLTGGCSKIRFTHGRVVNAEEKRNLFDLIVKYLLWYRDLARNYGVDDKIVYFTRVNGIKKFIDLEDLTFDTWRGGTFLWYKCRLRCF